MLILSRKKGESIKIGDDIEIFVAEIKGDKVRLGISAPESMKICRTELYLTVRIIRKRLIKWIFSRCSSCPGA